MEELNRTVQFIGTLSPWVFVVIAAITVLISALQARQYTRQAREYTRIVWRQRLREKDNTIELSIKGLGPEARNELLRSVNESYARVREKYARQDAKDQEISGNLSSDLASRKVSVLLENLTNSANSFVVTGQKDAE